MNSLTPLFRQLCQIFIEPPRNFQAAVNGEDLKIKSEALHVITSSAIQRNLDSQKEKLDVRVIAKQFLSMVVQCVVGLQCLKQLQISCVCSCAWSLAAFSLATYMILTVYDPFLNVFYRTLKYSFGVNVEFEVMQ